jgi:hypothetical protein
METRWCQGNGIGYDRKQFLRFSTLLDHEPVEQQMPPED